MSTTRSGRSRWHRLVRGAAVVAAGLALGLPAAAAADPTREDVYETLNVDDVPADYIVLVDVSGSMATNGLYGRVKSTLRTFIDNLGASDHVEIYTFAESVSPCLAPANGARERIVDCLPARATGKQTDIGLAIDAAIQGLERDEAASVGAIVLLTDGAQQPGGGSIYSADTNTAAWQALGVRAKTLAGRHQIEGYAIQLGGEATGAGLLSAVIPNTTVLDPSGTGQLGEYLDRAKSGVRLAKAKQALAADVGKGVRADWSLPTGSGVPAAVTLTLTAETSKAPLTVSGLAVTAPNGVTVTGELPGTVVLAPGESRAFPLAVTWSPDAGLVPFSGEHTLTVPITVNGDVTSPWATALEGAIDLGTPAHVGAATKDLPLTAAAGTIWAQIGVGLVVLLLIAAGVVVWYYRTHARMSGTMAAVDGATGRDVGRFPLQGRRAQLRGQNLIGSARVSARPVTATPDNTEGRDYVVVYSGNGPTDRGRFPAGRSKLVGRVAFEHVSPPAAQPESVLPLSRAD